MGARMSLENLPSYMTNEPAQAGMAEPPSAASSFDELQRACDRSDDVTGWDIQQAYRPRLAIVCQRVDVFRQIEPRWNKQSSDRKPPGNTRLAAIMHDVTRFH